LEFTSVRVAFTVVRRSGDVRDAEGNTPITAEELRYAIEAALPRELGGGLVEVGAVEFAKMGDFVTTDEGFVGANLHPELNLREPETMPALDFSVDYEPAFDREVMDPEPTEAPFGVGPTSGLKVMSLGEFLEMLRQQQQGPRDAQVDVRKLLGEGGEKGTKDLPIGPHGIGCECPWPEDKIN
jgi:hypothetical protein